MEVNRLAHIETIMDYESEIPTSCVTNFLSSRGL